MTITGPMLRRVRSSSRRSPSSPGMRTSVTSRPGRPSARAARTASPALNSRTVCPASRRASASTKRTPRSSSAIQISVMVPLHRKVQGEHRFTGATGKAQVTTVFERDLPRQRQAEARAIRAARDQRLEKRIAKLVGHTRAIVDHIDAESGTHGALAQTRTVLDSRAQGDRRRAGFAGVAGEIEEYLEKPIRVADAVRQAGIVVVADTQGVGFGTDQAFEAFEQFVDVDRA